MPDVTMHCYLNEGVDGFTDWVRRKIKSIDIEIISFDQSAWSGWDIKASVLLDLMKRGIKEPIWIDSDIILTRDATHFFNDLSDRSIVLASQKGEFNSLRTTCWGLKVKRRHDHSVNTCIMRVTQAHISLLEEWNKYLQKEKYLENKRLPHSERAPWLHGAQDILEGLLAANLHPEWEQYDLKFILSGDEILHESDYGIKERWEHRKEKLPPFIHAQGLKPWYQPYIERKRLKDIQLELSPYLVVAREFASDLESTFARKWIQQRTYRGQMCSLLTGNNIRLQAIPILLLRCFWERIPGNRE